MKAFLAIAAAALACLTVIGLVALNAETRRRYGRGLFTLPGLLLAMFAEVPGGLALLASPQDLGADNYVVCLVAGAAFALLLLIYNCSGTDLGTGVVASVLQLCVALALLMILWGILCPRRSERDAR
ncbi:MAG TPA: hypothetical protein PKG80_05490 [Acidobacteriota bacterium]|nr:hypothetical protein [Acidobacteriota bacterium]